MVGEPLAFGGFQRSNRALHIAETQSDPVIVSEVELREITVEVLLGAMLIDALYAPLEDREVAFDRVRVDLAASVFASRVLHGRMLGEVTASLAVQAALVSEEPGVASDVRLYDLCHGNLCRHGNVERAH